MANKNDGKTWQWSLNESDDTGFMDIDFSEVKAEKKAAAAYDELFEGTEAAEDSNLLDRFVEHSAESVRASAAASGEKKQSEHRLQFTVFEKPAPAEKAAKEPETKDPGEEALQKEKEKKFISAREKQQRRNMFLCIAGAVVVVFLLALLLKSCFGGNDDPSSPSKPDDGNSVWTEAEENSALSQLVYSYYDARKNGNSAAMRNVLVSNAVINSTTIELESRLFEDFKNMKIYQAKGASAGEYAVCVIYDVKFVYIDTLAPSQAWLYAVTEASGKLRLMTGVEYTPSEGSTEAGEQVKNKIYDKLLELVEDKDISAKVGEVEGRYNEAVVSDEKLSKLMENIRKGIYELPVPSDSEDPGESTGSDPVQPTSPSIVVDPVVPTKDPDGFMEMHETMYVSTNLVNVRSAPDTAEQNVIAVMSLNEAVQVTAYNDEWFRISLDGSPAYIYKDYLSLFVNVIPFEATMYINYYLVNLRSGPQIADNILTELPEGTAVQVTGKLDNWYQVKTDLSPLGIGFVSADYLQAQWP